MKISTIYLEKSSCRTVIIQNISKSIIRGSVISFVYFQLRCLSLLCYTYKNFKNHTGWEDRDLSRRKAGLGGWEGCLFFLFRRQALARGLLTVLTGESRVCFEEIVVC